MRFGRTLALSIYKPWKEQYIDYAKLKKLLRDDEGSAANSPSRESPPSTVQSWTDEDESAFSEELVNVQLEKVHAFHRDTYERLREEVGKCEARLDDVVVRDVQQQQHHDGEDGGNDDEGANTENGNGNGNGKQAVLSEEEKQKVLKEVIEQLDKITKETNELEKYSRINYTGFLKACKKHDRRRGGTYRLRPLLQVRLAALPFNKEDYSPLLYRLSAMYSFVRQHLTSEHASATDRRSTGLYDAHVPGKEEYVSHKFWVHVDNLLEVKTIILRRLPVLVYNSQTSKVAEGNTPDPSITSLYFDNPSFSLYTNKVDDGEANSLRLRWYGQLEDKPQIWVEKKTIQEDGVSQEARLTTKEKNVQSFVKGEYGLDKQIQKISDRAGADSTEATGLRSATEEIQKFIKEQKLQPVLRANYTRTAFQIPGDDRVRISLDTNLVFIREDAIDSDRPCRDPEAWHRTDIDGRRLEFPFNSVKKGEVSRFPFAVLEIKIKNAGASKRTEWIEELKDSHLVREAPRFSKFVHGVSVLFEDYVNTFPFWLSAMETDIRRNPQEAFEAEQERKKKVMEDDVAVGSFLKGSPLLRADGVSGKNRQPGVISPVGSPSLGASNQKSNALTQHFAERKAAGKLSSSLNAEMALSSDGRPEAIAEEAADDEGGAHAKGTEVPDYGTLSGSGVKHLLPSFSTSKYAAYRRDRGKQASLPPGVSKPDHWIKDQGPVKVEPKVWLANQRTYIKWQHVSVLLASLSLGLYNAAGANNNVARALAVVYTIVAVFAGGWGYFIFIWRSRLIEGRSGKDFDAVTGPVVVCVGLAVALCLNFGFKYRELLER